MHTISHTISTTSAYHQVADLCAVKGEGGTKELVYRAIAHAFLTVGTSHWPDDFKSLILQTARSRQQLLDGIIILDFERHTPAFKLLAFGVDCFSIFPACEDFLEVRGDRTEPMER